MAYLPSCGEVCLKPKALELCNKMNIISKRGRIIIDHDGFVKFVQTFKYSSLKEIEELVEAAHCRASVFFDMWHEEIESVSLIGRYIPKKELAGRK